VTGNGEMKEGATCHIVY